MAISFSEFISIQSSAVASASTAVRDLVQRTVTTNPLLPPKSFVSFENLSEIENYFGSTSEEYYRGEKYFAYFLQNQGNPDKMQFERWTKTATAPMIFCIQDNATTLADWNAISTGAFTLTMGGFTFSMTALSFTASANLAAVATVLQTAIQGKTGGGAMWTAATVTYNSVYGGFLLTGGAVGSYDDPIVVTTPTSGVDITPKGLLGWIPQQTIDASGNLVSGAIWARGSAAETITENMTLTDGMSTNFASFVWCWNCGVTLSEAISAATLNYTWNVKYFTLFGYTSSTYSAWQAALAGFGGTGLTKFSLPTTQVGNLTTTNPTVTGLQDTSLLKVGQPLAGTNIPVGAKIASIPSATSVVMSANATATSSVTITFTTMQFPEQFPATLVACVDYDGTSTVVNYMYKKDSGNTASVATDEEFNTLNALNLNFFGVTQTAGQLISFYQPGVLMGVESNGDLLDMGIYANEIWFKDRLGAKCMDVFTGNPIVPTSPTGKNMISNAMQTIINQAKRNGTIIVVELISDPDLLKQFQDKITGLTGDPKAYQDVLNNGYWKNVVIQPYSTNPVKYKAVPTIVYTGAHGISKVEGKNLIV